MKQKDGGRGKRRAVFFFFFLSSVEDDNDHQVTKITVNDDVAFSTDN